MIVRSLPVIVLVAADLGTAAACPPAVRLVGDADLVAAVARQLEARGIATDLPGCAAITARLEQRDQTIAISIDTVERQVREIETAATVIESFTRDDAAPLLVVRDVARPAPPVVVAPPKAARRRLHLFAGLESAVAIDRSLWLGLQLGGCWMVHIVCIAMRARSGSRVDGNEEVERQSWEALIGVDVPFAFRGWSIAPGIAAGPSGMETRSGMESESTNGLRADAHLTLSIPIATRFAIDVHVAGNLLQPIHFDDRSAGMLPPEPWGFARFGVGLRYGAR